MLSLDTIRSAPKALLHDHLDGGLRPATIVDLAREHGYRDLPTHDVDALGAWFRRGADRKSLELYLETFVHTLGVMQHPDAIARVAAECAEDLAADGVVYAEVRLAPELCTDAGLTPDGVVLAVLEGFRVGMERAARAGTPIVVRSLVTAMRQRDRASEIAEVALRHREDGVVGFDLAGPEAGYPPSRHRAALDRLRGAGLPLTIHAGESFGPPSIRDALDCGADRLGHGNHLVDDIALDADGVAHLGPLARRVLDAGVPLEQCPTSNLHTGAYPSYAAHPFGRLRQLGFRVTVNTDNRLMSGVSATGELAAMDATFGLGLDGLESLALTAIDAAFLPDGDRAYLVDEVVRPAYARLRAADAG